MPFGPNLRPLPKSSKNGRRAGFAPRSFSAISVRFSTTQSIFPIPRDPKLTAEALGLGWTAPKKKLWTPVSMPFGPSLRLSQTIYEMAEG